MHERYYTDEQLAELAGRADRLGPEGMERARRDWAELIDAMRVEMERGTDPADPRVQELAARWRALVEQFTGGDPGIRENLRRLYADQANWPATFQKPYGDDVGAFICKVKEAREEK